MEAKKILIIEDDKDIRNVVKDFLHEQGYTVLIAEDGSSGLQKAASENPSLVLLDVGLPDMSGYEVCRRIRSIASLRYTPVIMLTARTSEQAEINGFKAGADDYVAKPFKPGQLLARIQTAIGRNLRELGANPLTLLPGNVTIHQEIQNRIEINKKFAVLYFDLNNFKAFNDRYGFVRGDKAIKLTANILTSCLRNWGGKDHFLGHVGGDDFVAIASTHDVDPLCETLIRQFDELIPRIYDDEDREKGKIPAVDRKGHTIEVPLMGLAIAVVTNRQKAFQHPGEIALIAGDLKKWLKAKNKSAFVVDRRTQ